MPKIIFLSDLHGQMSTLDLYAHLKPDLFVLCGDIAPKSDLVVTTPVLYTHGNHDNIPVLRRRLGDGYLHLGITEIFGLRFMGIGGVFDGVRNILHGSENLTPASVIDGLLKEKAPVDIIFSHDPPALADPRGAPALDPLLTHFKPKDWVYGHLHERLERTIQGTRLVGLCNPMNEGQDLILDI